MSNLENEYEDIIDLPHHKSKKHHSMSLDARLAQFAPFAALTGYDEEIKETSRITTERADIDDNLKIILDEKLQIIRKKLEIKPLVTLTYFKQDLKKSGGKYITVIGNVKKIDEFRNIIILEDNTEIPITELIEISGEIFNV